MEMLKILTCSNCLNDYVGSKWDTPRLCKSCRNAKNEEELKYKKQEAYIKRYENWPRM